MCHILKKLKEIDIILVENALLANEYTYIIMIFFNTFLFQDIFFVFLYFDFFLVVTTTTPLPVDY